MINSVSGWEEGKSLGKDKQGIKCHVRVKNKQDTLFCLNFFYYVLFYMISVFQILEKGEGKV
jgi:hypothetical protein